MNKDNQIVIYRAKDDRTRLEVNLERETVWLTQAQMATLFDAERSVITKHIRNIFQSKELTPKSNVQKMHIAGSDKPVAFYTLDMIIAVGYRLRRRPGRLPVHRHRAPVGKNAPENAPENAGKNHGPFIDRAHSFSPGLLVQSADVWIRSRCRQEN